MFEIIVSGGILMVPIIASSVIAIAIIIERFWTLKPARIAPEHTLADVWSKLCQGQLDAQQLRELRQSSPLGQILAAGLVNAKAGRSIMIESIEQSAAHVVHDMERYLSALGSIAAITPLLGLLGTVFGMIQVFGEIMTLGSNGNTAALAGGIAQALITTAAGLFIAIPSILPFNYFNSRAEDAALNIEKYATSLEIVYEKLNQAQKQG